MEGTSDTWKVHGRYLRSMEGTSDSRKVPQIYGRYLRYMEGISDTWKVPQINLLRQKSDKPRQPMRPPQNKRCLGMRPYLIHNKVRVSVHVISRFTCAHPFLLSPRLCFFFFFFFLVFAVYTIKAAREMNGVVFSSSCLQPWSLVVSGADRPHIFSCSFVKGAYDYTANLGFATPKLQPVRQLPQTEQTRAGHSVQVENWGQQT